MKPAKLLKKRNTIFFMKSSFLFLLIFVFFGLHFKQLPQENISTSKNTLPTEEKSGVLIPTKNIHGSQSGFYQLPLNNFWVFLWILAFIGSNFFLIMSLKKTKFTVQELNQRLNTLSHELKESNMELDTFLYKASHDLKGPISTLDGLCNIGLLDSRDLPIEQYFHLQKEVIHKMQLLLFRLVEIGDIRNHTFKASHVKLNRFCRSIVRSMNRVEGFEKINFHIDIPEGMQVYTDVEMLEIAVDNIVKNAIQHANYSNEKNATVGITARNNGKNLELLIADNGLGIPPRIRGRIFDMFFRGNNYLQGFGLGLYKSKVAAKKIQGEIKLLKSDEQGSTFSLILPQILQIT